MTSETRTLVSILEHAERHAGMVCLRRTGRDAVAFLMGLDAGHGYGLFKEFGAWLLATFGLPQSHRNLAWPSLIARHVCPERWDRPEERTDGDDADIFHETFRLAREFLSSTGRDRLLDAAGQPPPAEG